MEQEFSLRFVFENTLSVRLPQPINLTGYEVCVKQLRLPATYYNIPSCKFEHRGSTDKKVLLLPAGYYANNQELVNALNLLLEPGSIQIVLNKNTQTALVEVLNSRASIKLSPFLAQLLRLPATTIRSQTMGTGPAKLSGTLDVAVVACDFVQPSIFNDRYANVLHVCTIGGDNQCMGNAYAPTRSEWCENMQIRVLNASGNPIYFMGGSALVNLHFRKMRGA